MLSCFPDPSIGFQKLEDLEKDLPRFPLRPDVPNPPKMTRGVTPAAVKPKQVLRGVTVKERKSGVVMRKAGSEIPTIGIGKPSPDATGRGHVPAAGAGDMTFKDFNGLGLGERLVELLGQAGLAIPTAIQALLIPAVLRFGSTCAINHCTTACPLS